MAKYDADALFQELDRRNSAGFAPPPVAYTPPRLPGETPPAGKYNADALFQELDRRNSTTSMWEPVQMAINSASYGDGVTQAKLDKTRFDLNKWVGEQAIPVNKYTHAEAQRQLQRAQMDHTLRDSPHTARWFTEQVQQGKTPYDVGTLANIERVTRVAPLLLPAAAGQSYAAIGGTTAVPGAFFDVVAQALEPVFGKLPRSELTNIGELLTEYGKKVAGEVPDDLNVGEKGLVSAAGSLGAFATSLPMAVFGLPGVLGAMSVSVGGSTYLENLKTTGNAATAMFHGILDAGYEYLLEKAGGTGVLFDKAAWSKGLVRFLAKLEGRELMTELPTTFFQKANQYILQNPERTFEQFMTELPEDLAVTAIATLFSAKGQAIAFKAVDKLADLGNTTAKAQAAHDNLTALLDNVAKSELYLNDPDTFAQFFQGVAGDATVTVDPVKLVEAMTAANVTEEALPSLKDQINAPGEIELTVQELATAFAGTGAETTLLQHVRPEPDLPTLAESKEQTKAAFEAFQEAGEKAMARFQADEVANAALDAIQEDIAADVQATGMFGPHYASGYGTLMRHFYATMANAHGVSPLQIRDGWTDANGVEHRGYNPRVIGPTGQVRGRSPATVTDFKPGRIANLRNRDNWAVLEAGNPNGTEATPEENAASMAKLKAYLDGEGIEYHDAKGSYFGTKADSLMLLGVTAERASEIGNMFGQESIATRHGLVFGDGTVAQATGIKEVKDTEAEDHTFLPAFGSAFRLEIPESAFENRVKLNEVLNQSVSTRTPTQKAGRGDPHLTTDLDVDYNVVEQDADLVARMATVVKTYPGIKKGLRNPNKIVEAFIKHVEDNLSWLYDNVPPEIRERSKLWYDGGRRILERWVDKYGFTDAQIAGVIAVLSPQTEWDMNVTRAERILDIWTQQQDFAWSDEMNAEADAIDSIKPVLREAIRGKKLSELDSDLLRGVWIRVYDQAHNPRVVRGITPEGGFAAFKKTMAGKVKTSTWGSFAEIGKAVRILRDGSIPNISRSLGNEHKVRNFYNNLFDPSDSRSVTIDTHAVAAGLLRPLAGGSIEVSDNLGARPRHDPTGTNGTYVLYAEAYRRVAMAKGVLPRELQSIAWEAVRRLFPDNYKNDATRAEIDALWKPNETGKESADEIRSKILENRGGRIPNPAWERSGTGLDAGQPSSTYQSGVLERSWADGTPGTRAGGYFAQTVPATGKPAGLTITGVHFSPGEQTSLLPSKYGKGLEGAERARVMASKDARIKRRTHFYVNTGQGVFPEAGTGGKAHVSELTNLYDADVDALGLFKGKADEQLNAAESAVLDAGYSGYVMRGFGNQGAAVVFGARVGDPGKPDAEVLRPVVVTGTDLMGDGRGFTEFFSEASKGNRAPEEPYKPVLDIGGISEFSEEYVKHRGNFDDHIASSIPGFREVQQIVGDAITKAYPGGAALLDLGASEGAFGKAITAVSGGAVRTLSLDPNLEMANFFSEHSQVPGADYVVAALGSPEDAGKTAWTEGDTPIPFFAPTQAYDIIHEAMVFQFISNGRNAQVARVKEMLKPGGVAFFEEKTADDSPEFVANEAQKDAFKNQFFSKRQIEEKSKEVLARGAEAVAEEEKKREQNTVGMNDLMTTRKELEAVLLRNFKHVVQYWDSGNFAGYMASDDPNALKKLEGNMLPTDSEFAAISTPRKVTSPAPLATKERGIPTKFVGGKEEASVPVAPAAQYSETQRLRQALTTSKDLPHGAMTAARWREYIGKVLPDLLPKIEASGAFERVHGMVYRDELARAIEPPEGQFYQKVWHGTPHIWAPEPGFPHGRPRLDKMGTGEGAQAYGWGFYIAEAEEVGAGYQKTLAFRAFDIAQEAEKRGISLNDGAHGEIVRHSATDRTPQEAAKYVQYANSASRSIPLEDLAQFIADYREASRGSLYQLDIPDASLPYLLDWDRPLSQQTPEVRKAIHEFGGTLDSYGNQTGEIDESLTGREFYEQVKYINGGTSKAASEYLASLGIVGNRYLDGQSRNRPLKDIKREFLDELPEDADFSEVSDMIGTGRFSPKNDALLKALRDDDWLGFDYPAQAISAALGKDLSGYDASPALLRAVESAKEGGTYNYVIWDQPTLDKIALLERNGEKLDAMQQFYQAGWYSPLTRAFQNAKQATMPGSQWASWLAGNKAKLGLKDDEIVFSGLDNYLELRGKDKVTREEIVDYLSGNGVRVEETVLGGAQGITKKDLDNAEVEARRTGDWTAYEDLTRRYEDEQIGNNANDSGNKTVYASYVPPGGIPGTYREILVALPERGRAEFERIKAKVDNDEPLTPEENEIYGTYEPGADVYRSHHWNGVPNVLVHLRVDEVEGADGQRVLRVIEVQSDWGQQGKKEGFVTGTKEEWLGKNKAYRDAIKRDATGAELDALKAEVDAASAALEGVTASPFVTDTKAWVALGIKRAIMHAVDVGATGVVFATGEQNAALYSLEKQVSSIEAVQTEGSALITVSAYKGREVASSKVFDSYNDPGISDFVGKEMADKIAVKLGNSPLYTYPNTVKFSGLDLKVGGEGMKAFYDKIVPQVANDVLKKLGAGVKVEKFIVPTPVDEATTDRALVMDEDVEHFGFNITPEFRAKVMEGVPLFQVKPAYAVRSPDGKYQGIRELTDKEARELIDLGYQVNRVTPGYGQAENAMGGFNPSTLEITLLAKANPSTFLHETGHFFLTAYADMAAQEGAPQQVVDDMGAILKWFGIEANPGGMPGEGGAGGTFAQTATSAFKKWFGDSKVVDPEGRPLVVYHGSTRGGIRHATIQHSFFTPSRAVARTYSEDDYKEGDTPVVQEVFLRMENPLIVDAYGSAWMHIPFEGERYTTDSLANLAKKRGYDGVIIKNIEDNVNDEDLPPSDVYITLGGRAQIKSATSNLGTFDPSNSDILKQGGAPGTRGPLPYGRTPLEVWNAMSVDQQRPYHEQFAESFEQYLFSGKAPTRELQSLFRRFATWLTKVYGSIKEFIAGHPGAQLNPDLAAIMDRMLATEEEIKQAEDNRNYEALFRTAAEAGMTPAQFAAYLDLPEEARAAAEEQLRTRSLRDMKWLQNRKNKTVAALQKEAAAVRAEVRKEVAETVAQEPIFRALRWLKRGELTNPDTGEEVKVTAGNKLSIPALEGMYPEGALGDKPDWRSLGYGQYGMLANEGLHPDVVADMFGFDSGAALVDALVNAPKFKDEVEGRTDQIMLERHGDLSSPDKIAQAADEAIHNEVRTKIVATELSFLDKLTGSPSFLIKAAKEYARQLVANRTSKTLKAWVFAADEVRASKAAAAALKKGDTKAAANHKRVELLNHAAVREAHSAEKELKKIVDRLRKIASYKDDDSSAKARDMDMVNAVRVVLYRFGLGTERKGKTATEYLSLVEANDPAMGAALRDLVDSTTDSAKDWRDLKLSELRDLRDAVESVWALAKRSRQMEVDGKLVPRRQVEQELYDRLDEIGIPDRLPGEGQAVTEAERNWMKFATFVAALRRVESWVGAKDGKAMGPFRKYIWSQIKDAADTYRVKKAEYLKAYRELLDTIAPTLKRELIDAREIGYTFGKGEGGMGMVELLHAILHTGNASNKRKLLLGRGWATDNGDGTLDTSKWDAFIARMIQEGKLTKAHYDFAQGVWDMLDGMKPAAQKAHRSVFGRYFAEVTADAFTTPFGDYRGGYVPAQADPEIVQDAQLKELANQENENMVYAFPSTPKGFTKSRVEYNRPLRLDLRSLAGHIDKVLLFSYLTEPVSDVRRVILSKTVSQALGRVDPKAIGSILTPWLNRTAKQIVEDRVPGREPLARFWSIARARAGMAAMFANLANSAQQITGVSLAALKVRPKYLLEALAHGVASPRKTSDHVTAMSPYMRDRMHNDVVLMGEAIDEILLNPGVYESAKAWSAKHAYFMQRAVDNFFSPMVWMGAFNQAKENGSDDLEARRLADSAVRETQGSQAPEDIAAFEQGTAFYRMFVQFAGYFNMNANLLGTEFVKLSQDMGLKKGAGRGLYVLALGFYVPAVLGELIIQAFRGGPDDDDKDGEYLDDWLAAVFGYGPARYLTAMAPVVGQAANALVNTLNHKPYDDRISTAPAISMIESAVKAPISVYKAIADEGKSTKAVNDTATLISMTVGVPARAVAKPISYLTGVANEEIAPEDTYDTIRGTITGTASPGSKQ